MSEEEIIISSIKPIVNARKTHKDNYLYSLQLNAYQLDMIQGLLDLYNKEKEKNKALEEENRIFRKQINDAFDRGWIHKDKIKEFLLGKIRYRQFELQQEYKDFKDDIKLNTLQDIFYELLEDD